MNRQVQKITLGGLLLALCVVGANLKIMGSIAFDSWAAFLGALLLGPIGGMVLGASGHLVSALLAGMPLSAPVHLLVAAMMAAAAGAYGYVFHYFGGGVKSYVVATVVAYLLNVVIALALLYPLLHDLVWVLFVPLTMATVCNLALAGVVYKALPSAMRKVFYEM